MEGTLLQILFSVVGGIGVFLIGMMLLSDGLIAFAGDALKRALVRFTGTPFKAFSSGVLVTALVQSSTATTVTLIGFVSAGLITFSQATGVVIGASLGNTASGWIVAGLGLKFNLGLYSLPLIGIGALVKLLARGRWSGMGMALAGFGLLFLGLGTLQEGMRGLPGMFNLADLPASGYGARIVNMLIGLAMTALLQSSTAAIATTLTALHMGNINFDQAAAVVVGASIGTTLTGALVAIGGSIHAKRTALAYALFNAVAGLIAIVLLPGFVYMVQWLERHAGLTPGAAGLAAFHTLFIAVGTALILPVTARFAQLVERMLPEHGEDMAQRLDASLLHIPSVSIEASRRTLEQVTERLLNIYRRILTAPPPASMMRDLDQIQPALDRAFDFVTRIPLPAHDRPLADQRIAQLHAIDHLLRFRNRLQDIALARIDFSAPAYDWARENTHKMLNLALDGLKARNLAINLAQLEDDAAMLTDLSHQRRHDLLQEATPAGDSAAVHALRITDGFRWLERTANHIWRICHYLAQGRADNVKTPATDGTRSAPLPGPAEPPHTRQKSQ